MKTWYYAIVGPLTEDTLDVLEFGETYTTKEKDQILDELMHEFLENNKEYLNSQIIVLLSKSEIHYNI